MSTTKIGSRQDDTHTYTHTFNLNNDTTLFFVLNIILRMYVGIYIYKILHTFVVFATRLFYHWGLILNIEYIFFS